MAFSHRRRFALIVVLTITAVILTFSCSWFVTYTVVMDLVSNPLNKLSLSEDKRITGYIEGSFWYWPFEKSISEERENQLISAAIERATKLRDVSLLWTISERWGQGQNFSAFPVVAGQAITNDPRNASFLFNAIGSDGGIEALREHVDIESVLTSREDELVLSCLIGLPVEVLWEYRDLCYQILRSDDVIPACKEVLLTKVADGGVASEWFADQKDLLQTVSKTRDPEVQAVLKQIIKQKGIGVRVPGKGQR